MPTCFDGSHHGLFPIAPFITEFIITAFVKKRERTIPLSRRRGRPSSHRIADSVRERSVRFPSGAREDSVAAGGSYSEAARAGEAQGAGGEPSVAGIGLHAIAGLGVAGRARPEGASRRAGVV